MIKISIITSCFNREKTIETTLQSVLHQTYPHLEYIVIDGASTDHTMDIIKKYKGSITKIISEPDKGMYEGLNKGIRLATGDIVGLMHSDDCFYSEQTLEHVVDMFQKTGADLIYGNGLFVDENDISRIIRNWISGSYSRVKMRRGWLPLHPTVYVRRKCLERLGLYDESYKIAADSDFLVRYMYEANLKVAYLDEYIVKMRMGGLSTNPKKMIQKWKEDLRMNHSHGFSPYWTLLCKIVSKIPQFISAKFIKGI